MRVVSLPIASANYVRDEEQIFRDRVRREIERTEAQISSLTEKLRFANLQEFADDAAAGAGGLVQGTFYRTSTGALMVKL